jgi:hypothetical protein
MTAATDEDRWAQAQAVLDGVPTESTDRLLRSARRRRLVVVFSLLLAIPALALFFVLVLGAEGFSEHVRVPTWRGVVGFSISGVGLLLMVVALVVQFRAMRPLSAWRGPMNVLTRQQRMELLRQVRGRAPVPPERIPLGRHLAELLLLQRFAVVPQVGFLVNFAGQWIAEPATWRLVLIGFLALVLGAAGIQFRREGVRMRRFLEEHPDPRPAPPMSPDDE